MTRLPKMGDIVLYRQREFPRERETGSTRSDPSTPVERPAIIVSHPSVSRIVDLVVFSLWDPPNPIQDVPYSTAPLENTWYQNNIEEDAG